MNTREFGQMGENSAAEYLKSKGYHILERNLYIGHKEVDIIAENDKYLVFVEVKTRRQLPESEAIFGTPATAVDAKKKQNLVSAAEEYIKKNGCDKTPRIDVVEVFIHPFSEEYKVLDIRHYENTVHKSGKFSRDKYKYNDYN